MCEREMEISENDKQSDYKVRETKAKQISIRSECASGL